MLDTMPRDVRKKVLCTEEVLSIMPTMGQRILDAGDYDLQVAITEALCRMTSEKQRGELARQWFPMEFVTDAFKAIKDSEFETDCRKFLNLVNGMLGDRRRVFTYPCISAFLEDQKLQVPSDEKLEEFWIDFNAGTQSVSFYVSTDEEEDHQWETVCVTESEVELYNIEEIDGKLLFTINLNTPATVGKKSGTQLHIYFDSMLDIIDVARRIFGANKFKGFTQKKSSSVAKTAVHIIFEDNGSQVVIPESQGSSNSFKYIEACDVNESKLKKQFPSTSHIKQHGQELNTPCKNKVSEATMVLPIACFYKITKPSASASTPTLRKGRFKPPLEMVQSAERSTVPISLANTTINKSRNKLENIQFQKLKTDEMKNMDEHFRNLDGDEKVEIVLDTQPTEERDPPILPGLSESYLGEQKPGSSRTQTRKEKISVSKQFVCNQDRGINDGIIKQHSFSSVFEQMQTPKQPTKASNNPKIRQQLEECKYPNQDDSTVPVSHSRIESYERKKRGKHTDKELLLKPDALQKSGDCKIANETCSVNAQNIPSKNINPASDRKETHQCPSMPPKDTKKEKDKHQSTKFSLQNTRDFNTSVEENRDDVYSFYFRGSDDPIINLGSKDYHPQHLFSDTDTDKGADGSKTDISWLREPGRKKKPQIAGYSRQRQGKKTEDTSHNKLPKEEKKACKKPFEANENRKASKYDTGETTKNRPQRATVVKKNYKELSDSEEDSASVSKSKDLAKPYSTADKLVILHASRNIQHISYAGSSLQLYDDLPSELSMEKQKRPENPNSTKPPQKTARTENNSINLKMVGTTCQKSEEELVLSTPSPASIEQNRSDSYMSVNELKTTHRTTGRSSSLLLCGSSPEKITPVATKNIPTKIFYSTKGKSWSNKPEKYRDTSLDRTGGKKPADRVIEEQTCSSVSSIESLLTVSSKILDQCKKRFLNEGCSKTKRIEEENNGFLVNISNHGSDHSENRKQGNSHVSGLSDGSRQRPHCEMLDTNIQYGPSASTTTSSLKRGNIDVSPTGSDYQIKRRKAKLLPRKLFTATEEQSLNVRVSESLSTVSGNDISTTVDTWNGSGVGVMCQQISKEFTRKFQIRSKKMEYFTKQSLKSTQKHLTSVSVQMQECRIKRLDKFEGTILEEIDNFEKDSVTLKSMEKEFMNFWTQQVQTFSSYRKNEQRRIHSLRSSLENNVYHSIDFEENIFNSEMTVMKDKMKRVQENLLKEMQDEELLSVRRGLQSLFMAGARADQFPGVRGRLIGSPSPARKCCRQSLCIAQTTLRVNIRAPCAELQDCTSLLHVEHVQQLYQKVGLISHKRVSTACGI
ncbi:synaptonemal complex protein 2 [Pelodytes ibericus]